MAGRKWHDINEVWLEQYLTQRGHWPLWADDPEGAELYEDHPFGWQAAWVLSDAEWSRLRGAWKRQKHRGSVQLTQKQEAAEAAEKLRDAYRRIAELKEENRALKLVLKNKQ